MPLQIPAATSQILESVEASRQPLAEFDLADQILRSEAGDLSAEERKGAFAEWAAFFFRPVDEDASPWNTYYGPTIAMSDAQGRPVYSPDLAQIDAETVAHWETRAAVAKHTVLRARYADLVWDLKLPALTQRADIEFARIAVDAYLDAASANLYKYAIHAAQALRRAIQLAVAMKDTLRMDRCKQTIIVSLDAVDDSRQIGNWVQIVGELLRNKKASLSLDETDRLITGLERLLSVCTTLGTQFDPFAAEATALVLAAHYERISQNDQVHRVIRAYGKAFEYIAANANATLAMGWLQPVYDEYRRRGMTADADHVLRRYLEKGKRASDDLKTIQAPVEIPAAQFEQFLDMISEGTARDCLGKVTVQFVPKVGRIRDLLQEMLTRTPILARIEVTRIVGDHFAAQAGSIESDPDGRLIMQLAQYLDGESLFLVPALRRIREKHALDATTTLAVLEESPVFDTTRHGVLKEGLEAYLENDHVKAIHVLIPQVEHTLRRLLDLVGVPTVRAGRNGTMRVKTLNEILREPAIHAVLGEDIQLYLLTLLADQRGQNIRNLVCHGLATPAQMNQQVADRIFHVLLTLARVRKQPEPEGPDQRDGVST